MGPNTRQNCCEGCKMLFYIFLIIAGLCFFGFFPGDPPKIISYPVAGIAIILVIFLTLIAYCVAIRGAYELIAYGMFFVLSKLGNKEMPMYYQHLDIEELAGTTFCAAYFGFMLSFSDISVAYNYLKPYLHG